MNVRNLSRCIVTAALLPWALAGCSAPITPTPVPPTRTTPVAASPTPVPTRPTTPSATASAGDLSAAEVATLGSLAQVDDYPLYTMRYQGAYDQQTAAVDPSTPAPAWACSLFAALGDADHRLYGRNFDWDYSPALLLFTDPPAGYASVSMVDIAYLGFAGEKAHGIADLPLAERRSLLNAPLLPFDGMNERGLVVGMAAVPPGQMEPDPNKETVGSLGVIRQMLDRAGSVDEAVAILGSYNVDMGSGPPIHYLVADASGRAALVEFYRGEMVVIPNEEPWHLATNFLRAAAGESPAGWCGRYDELARQLAASQGRLVASEALGLLSDVAQAITQWSVVYEMSTGDVHVVMGRQYVSPHTFRLDLAGE